MSTIIIRKSLVSSFGGPSHVSIITTTISPPSANEVQPKVLCSGFGGSDIVVRLSGYPYQKAAPLTTGYSCISTVTPNSFKSTRFLVDSLEGCLCKYEGQPELINLPDKYLSPPQASI